MVISITETACPCPNPRFGEMANGFAEVLVLPSPSQLMSKLPARSAMDKSLCGRALHDAGRRKRDSPQPTIDPKAYR
ncbi:hypothetical protein QUA95_28695 [Microcoleus sp. F10_A2]